MFRLSIVPLYAGQFLDSLATRTTTLRGSFMGGVVSRTLNAVDRTAAQRLAFRASGEKAEKAWH